MSSPPWRLLGVAGHLYLMEHSVLEYSCRLFAGRYVLGLLLLYISEKIQGDYK
jgi:hypothetical protein